MRSHSAAEQALFLALYVAMIVFMDKDRGVRVVAGFTREYSRLSGDIGAWFNAQSIRSYNVYRELIRP